MLGCGLCTRGPLYFYLHSHTMIIAGNSLISFPDSSPHRCTVHHRGAAESSRRYKRLTTALLPGSQFHPHPLVQGFTCKGSQSDRWRPTSDNRGRHPGADVISRHRGCGSLLLHGLLRYSDCEELPGLHLSCQ